MAGEHAFRPAPPERCAGAARDGRASVDEEEVPSNPGLDHAAGRRRSCSAASSGIPRRFARAKLFAGANPVGRLDLSIRLTLGEDKSMMVDNDELFTGSIPELYDTYLVPLIFEGFARDLALRTVAGRPLAILEIAAGSGVVARALAPQLGEWAHYVVTDLNRQMLDHARVRQGAGSADRVASRRCGGAAVRRPIVRQGLLPVRRHVLRGQDRARLARPGVS